MDLEKSPDFKDSRFLRYLIKYIPYWPFFLLAVAFCGSAAWLYNSSKLPVYESSASILVKDKNKGSDDPEMMKSLDVLAASKIIENEIEILKSKKLLVAVVEKLGLYVNVYEKKFISKRYLYTESPIIVEAQQPDQLVPAKEIIMVIGRGRDKIKLDGIEYRTGQWVQTKWGVLRFKLRPEGRVSDQLYLSLLNPTIAAEYLGASIDITSAGKLTSVIDLKMTDSDPRRSEDVLNNLIQYYNATSIEGKRELAANTLKFLDERIKQLGGELGIIQQRLQKYKSNKGAVDITSQGRLFLENVSENDQRLNDIQMKLSVLNQIEESIFNEKGGTGLIPTTLGFDEPVLTNLLNKLYELELSYEKLRRTTGEKNPDVLALADQIKRIKPAILENIRSQRKSLESNRATLNSTNMSYSSVLESLPQQERDLLEISREQSVKTSIYNFLLQRREEAAISLSAIVPDTQVIDMASSSADPVGFSGKIIYVASLLFAFGVVIGLVELRESFTGTVLFRNDLESLVVYPVVGEIAYGRSKDAIVIKEGSKSLISEEFRLLRTSLYSATEGLTSKRILVTSSIPGDGKSFVALNLAMTMAIAGKRTVLVELDLSNPSLSLKLGVNKECGVADYLKGETGLPDTITRAISKNLYFISAGNLPDNPSELLLQKGTSRLLDNLQSHFDVVILDSAPIGVLSDGYILSQLCDRTLFVVRHRHTPRRMLQYLFKRSGENRLKNVSVVFNGVKSRGFGKYSYGYGYGYHYAYNYKSNIRKNKKRAVA